MTNICSQTEIRFGFVQVDFQGGKVDLQQFLWALHEKSFFT